MEALTHRKVVFERGSWLLEMTNKADVDLIELFANTVWGTPGQTLFQHLNTRERIPQLQEAHYLSLQRNNQVTAGLTLCRRTAWSGDQTDNAFYIRYLSFSDHFRNKKPHKNDLARRDNTLTNPKSFIKRKLLEVFDTPEAFPGKAADPRKAIFYAFVESENERSLQMCRAFGFGKIRSFCTISFSRFYPKKDKRVSRLAANEKNNVLAAIQKQYIGHQLFFTDHLFYQDNYFVLKIDGEIVAGVQAVPVQWIVKNLPGLSGRITLNLLPRLPFISKLFNPRNFRFAVLEGIFAKPGYEHTLIPLFEAVLAEHQLNSALTWLDTESELGVFLKRSGRLGLLNQLNAGAPAEVLARFVNYPESAITAFREKPVYISALDIT